MITLNEYSDIAISEYINTLDFSVNGIDTKVFNALLLLPDSVFRKIIWALMDNLVSLPQLGELPSIDSASITRTLDILLSSTEYSDRKLVSDSFLSNGWTQFVSTTLAPNKSYIKQHFISDSDFLYSIKINLLGDVLDSYKTYDELEEAYLTMIETEEKIQVKISLLETKKDSLIDKGLPIENIHSQFEKMYNRVCFIKTNLDTSFFKYSSYNLLGFMLRELYETRFFQSKYLSTCRQNIINNFIDYPDENHNGVRSFKESIYDKASLDFLNFYQNPTVDFSEKSFSDRFYKYFTAKVIVPRYYNTFHFELETPEEEILPTEEPLVPTTEEEPTEEGLEIPTEEPNPDETIGGGFQVGITSETPLEEDILEEPIEEEIPPEPIVFDTEMDEEKLTDFIAYFRLAKSLADEILACIPLYIIVNKD